MHVHPSFPFLRANGYKYLCRYSERRTRFGLFQIKISPKPRLNQAVHTSTVLRRDYNLTRCWAVCCEPGVKLFSDGYGRLL